MIFVPMAIQMMGHALVVPMLLRNALEDYTKVTGAAGSIFGFLYYMTTAAVSFVISAFHSDTIDNYAYLYAALLLVCIVLFYLTNKFLIKPVWPPQTSQIFYCVRMLSFHH